MMRTFVDPCPLARQVKQFDSYTRCERVRLAQPCRLARQVKQVAS
jgi:hypothetical protein